MAARPTSYEPLPRSSHAAIAVDNKLHMWGGWHGSKEKSQEVADKIEMFDISTELWEQKPTHGTPPPGLYDTAYTVVGSSLFVFGGSDGVSHHNTLFKLDLRSFQWEWVQVSNPSSSPQKKDSCMMVSYGYNQLVIFAGYTATGGGRTDELHAFDLDKGEYSLCTKPQAKQYFIFHVHGAVRKFRCYIWSDCQGFFQLFVQGAKWEYYSGAGKSVFMCKACRGVRGHAPPGNLIRHNLVESGTVFTQTQFTIYCVIKAFIIVLHVK